MDMPLRVFAAVVVSMDLRLWAVGGVSAALLYTAGRCAGRVVRVGLVSVLRNLIF